MDNIFEKLKGGIVVSCQAEGDVPFNSPEGVAMFALSAEIGGAAGIRSEGIKKTSMIKEKVKLPIIGLVKSQFDDGFVRITGSFKDAEDLLSIGTDIIAIDGTFRNREGLTGPKFIREIKNKFNCKIMADISTIEEGIACAAEGADCISTTLSGYTPDTEHSKSELPDFALVNNLVGHLNIPVFAEGRINTPEMAAKMKDLGAWSVVVGTAITRPWVVTNWYVKALSNK